MNFHQIKPEPFQIFLSTFSTLVSFRLYFSCFTWEMFFFWYWRTLDCAGFLLPAAGCLSSAAVQKDANPCSNSNPSLCTVSALQRHHFPRVVQMSSLKVHHPFTQKSSFVICRYMWSSFCNVSAIYLLKKEENQHGLNARQPLLFLSNTSFVVDVWHFHAGNRVRNQFTQSCYKLRIKCTDVFNACDLAGCGGSRPTRAAL